MNEPRKPFFGRPQSPPDEVKAETTAPEVEQTPVPAVQEVAATQVTKTVNVTELDAHIMERVRTQASQPEVTADDIASEVPGLHRLSLDDYFEKQSFDCTRGDSCTIHKKVMEEFAGIKKQKLLNPGKYVLRWMKMDQRSLDDAVDVKRWQFVTRTKSFSDAPTRLFAANGGVVRGDVILMYLPVDVAQKLRKLPSQRSLERLRSQITPVKNNPKRVLMTGSPENDKYYEPSWGNESAADQPGASQEFAPGEVPAD